MSKLESLPSRRLRGRLLIVAAAVLWSSSGFFAKSPVFLDWPATGAHWPIRGPLLAFWRALFASVVLLPFVRRPRWTPRLVPAMVAFAAMNLTYLTALTTTTAANAIWLQYTAPGWVFLIGLFAFREPFQRRDAFMLACGLCGVLTILAFEARGESLVGVGNGLLSGVCFAAVVVTMRSLRDEDSAWIVAINHLSTVAVFSPYCLAVGDWPTSRQIVYLAGFGILQMGLPYVLFARGLRDVPGNEASLLVLIEPVLVPLWVYVAWHGTAGYEAPRWWTFVGGLIILIGLVGRYGVEISRRR